MIHIAIVEDTENDYDLFRDCLSNYKEKYNNLEEIDVIWYKNIPDFIKNFKSVYCSFLCAQEGHFP